MQISLKQTVTEFHVTYTTHIVFAQDLIRYE